MKTARTYEELKSRLDELSGNTAEKQADTTAEAKKRPRHTIPLSGKLCTPVCPRMH